MGLGWGGGGARFGKGQGLGCGRADPDRFFGLGVVKVRCLILIVKKFFPSRSQRGKSGVGTAKKNQSEGTWTGRTDLRQGEPYSWTALVAFVQQLYARDLELSTSCTFRLHVGSGLEDSNNGGRSRSHFCLIDTRLFQNLCPFRRQVFEGPGNDIKLYMDVMLKLIWQSRLRKPSYPMTLPFSGRSSSFGFFEKRPAFFVFFSFLLDLRSVSDPPMVS